MPIDNAAMHWLQRAYKLGASDLILAAGSPCHVYVNGRLEPISDYPLNAAEVHDVVGGMLGDHLHEELERTRDVDFSLGHPLFGRCRANVHYQRNTLAAAIRFVPDAIPRFESLNLPPIVQEFACYPRGLVLITGGTGSGKSTTMAAIVDEINQTRPKHIITLEDPIEYAFKNINCVIEQREIGVDSPSFSSALRHIVRQKPDVIMIGEMRDLETIRTAITAAETGHLVLASLHTMSASQTVERIIDVFEAGQQAQIRIQLAGALRAIACQTLFPAATGKAMVPAVEVLISTPAISRAIREGETHLVQGMIETGAARGMQTLDQAIAQLLGQELISREDALAKATDPERLERTLARELEPVGAAAKPWE